MSSFSSVRKFANFQSTFPTTRSSMAFKFGPKIDWIFLLLFPLSSFYWIFTSCFCCYCWERRWLDRSRARMVRHHHKVQLAVLTIINLWATLEIFNDDDSRNKSILRDATKFYLSSSGLHLIKHKFVRKNFLTFGTERIGQKRQEKNLSRIIDSFTVARSFDPSKKSCLLHTSIRPNKPTHQKRKKVICCYRARNIKSSIFSVDHA